MATVPDAVKDEAATPVRAIERVNGVPAGWWEAAFDADAGELERKEWQMLMVVAYDIRNPRRLARVAKLCEDYGGRVQYSVFEVRLNADRFDEFWDRLLGRIDEKADRIVAYRVCQECVKKIRAGGTMVLTEPPPVAYIF